MIPKVLETLSKMRLSHTRIRTFKDCRKKFYYSYVLGIEPRERPLYFTTGGALHRGLELYYTGKSIEEILSGIRDYFNDRKPDIDDPENVDRWRNDMDMSIEIMVRYIEHYSKEQFEVVDIEREFNVPIVNPRTNRSSRNFTFFGIADGLVKLNGKYWLLEHKTTSRLTDQYKKMLTLDIQSISYIEALQRDLHIKIEGVIYNVLIKDIPNEPKVLKSGRLSTAMNQKVTVATFIRKMKELGLAMDDDYREYLDYLRANPREYFYREFIVFSQDDLEAWRAELWDIQKNIREAQRMEQFYKNTSQCTTMGTCSYFDICTAFDQEAVIDASYTQKPSRHEIPISA